MQKIIIFGGTFDPIHRAHIRVAKNVQNTFKFDKFIFLPCKEPLLKDKAKTPVKHRLKMLELALKDYPEFAIDLEEIKRDTPSYMYLTIENLKKKYPKDTEFTLLMGDDVFRKFHLWKKYQEIIKEANVLVIYRKDGVGKELPQDIDNLLEKYEVKSIDEFMKFANKKIYRFNAGDFNISSTNIRVHNNKLQQIEKLLPKEVFAYICENKLYKQT